MTLGRGLRRWEICNLLLACLEKFLDAIVMLHISHLLSPLLGINFFFAQASAVCRMRQDLSKKVWPQLSHLGLGPCVRAKWALMSCLDWNTESQPSPSHGTRDSPSPWQSVFWRCFLRLLGVLYPRPQRSQRNLRPDCPLDCGADTFSTSASMLLLMLMMLVLLLLLLLVGGVLKLVVVFASSSIVATLDEAGSYTQA